VSSGHWEPLASGRSFDWGGDWYSDPALPFEPAEKIEAPSPRSYAERSWEFAPAPVVHERVAPTSVGGAVERLPEAPTSAGGAVERLREAPSSVGEAAGRLPDLGRHCAAMRTSIPKSPESIQ